MKREHLVGITLWRLPLSILGGLLSSLAMPRENIWPLIFVSVAFLIVSVRGLRFFPVFSSVSPVAWLFTLARSNGCRFI